MISIHAPHAGSDWRDEHLFRPKGISIHAPHAGSDSSCISPCLALMQFQSTLPMRGATLFAPPLHRAGYISIHAPHAGSDDEKVAAYRAELISIHAPHAGSDFLRLLFCWCSSYFNPRSPCGERRCIKQIRSSRNNFNPRSPCGERLLSLSSCVLNALISIHAPHAGSDIFRASSLTRTVISIHAPHAGSDHNHCVLQAPLSYFNPRSPCGERQYYIRSLRQTFYFNPRSPCGERRLPPI